jgi:hypothetical protein
MGGIARVVAVGPPHHVTRRGNNWAEVFFSDADRRYYLRTLAHYGDEFKLRVWAYGTNGVKSLPLGSPGDIVIISEKSGSAIHLSASSSRAASDPAGRNRSANAEVGRSTFGACRSRTVT